MSPAAVATGHLTAALELPPGLDPCQALTAADRLPGGWSLSPLSVGGEPCPVVGVTVTDTAPETTVSGSRVQLSLTQRAARSATLAYTTYTALERARQERHMLTLHANAAVTPSGRGVLLLGNKGAGKTSVTLALGERGFTHAGDDLSVLAEDGSGELLLLPGKATATVRPKDARRWQDPKPVIGLAPFLRRPVSLAAVVRLTVHPDVPSAVLVPATPFSANEQLRLHEALARCISGIPTPLTGPGGAPYGPVWPLDTPRLARWRTHLVARLEQRPYTYAYAPDAGSAADLITREYA
ncbi:hypothetical protein B7C62_12840 [Kitasatospora albolonga]|uniref:Serine kinase n=1 Tax=Kitasatospora albolonga TaxID=68173 RepID=A0ABC8BTI9_9ACTN|nr:hypothetical protein B7C62_12840 [Kitasatospora albolonga]